MSLTVKDYGAIADGGSHPLSLYYATLAAAQVDYPHATALTDELDWAAAQAAVRAIKGNGGTVAFPPGRYFLNQTIALPATPQPLAYGETLIHVEGDGAILKTAGGYHGTLMARTPPASQAVADTTTRVFVRGLQFAGGNSGAPDQVGLALNVGCRSAVEDCGFSNLDYGFVGRFCTQLNVTRVTYTNCRIYPDLIGYGNWPGADASNSQSNHVVHESCRVYNLPGAFAAYYHKAGNAPVYRNCVSEGGSPDYHFYFDDAGSTVVKSALIENPHIESNARLDAFYVRLTGGTVVIRGGYCPHGGLESMVHLEGGGNLAVVHLEDWGWWGFGSLLRTNGSGVFSVVGRAFGDLHDPAQWYGGVRYDGVIQDNRLAEVSAPYPILHARFGTFHVEGTIT